MTDLLVSSISPCSPSSPSSTSSEGAGWIKLNVGGRFFSTHRSTLLKSKFFKDLFQSQTIEKDETGAILVDRDGEDFSSLLRFLRSGTLPLPFSPTLASEFKFFGIQFTENISNLSSEILSLRIKFAPLLRRLEIRTIPTWSFTVANPSSLDPSEYSPPALPSPTPIEDAPLEVVLSQLAREGWEIVSLDLALLRDLALESADFSQDALAALWREASFKSVIGVFKRQQSWQQKKHDTPSTIAGLIQTEA